MVLAYQGKNLSRITLRLETSHVLRGDVGAMRMATSVTSSQGLRRARRIQITGANSRRQSPAGLAMPERKFLCSEPTNCVRHCWLCVLRWSADHTWNMHTTPAADNHKPQWLEKKVEEC